MEFLKEFSEKVGLGKIPTDGKKDEKYLVACKKLKYVIDRSYKPPGLKF